VSEQSRSSKLPSNRPGEDRNAIEAPPLPHSAPPLRPSDFDKDATTPPLDRSGLVEPPPPLGAIPPIAGLPTKTMGESGPVPPPFARETQSRAGAPPPVHGSSGASINRLDLSDIGTDPTQVPNPIVQKQIDRLKGSSASGKRAPGNPATEFESSVPEEVPAFLSSKWIRESPSWLVSTLIHVAIILFLALVPFREEVAKSLTLLLGATDAGNSGDELTAFEISDAESLQGQNNSDAMEDLALAASELVPAVPDIANIGSTVSKPDFSIRKGLTGRTGNMKGALLKAYGGTERTEEAVALGLEWLAKNQTSDGSWSLVSPYSEGGISENRSAATALALLAFMGAGSTHKGGEYQAAVFKGLNYLLKLQDDDGFFSAKSTGIQKTYAQAQASIAICELYGMTGDEKLREPAIKAVRYAISAQNEGGGWRYQPREVGDTSVTGWYVMALISARMSGLDVPSENLEKVHEFLDTVQRKPGVRGPEPDGELYAYQAIGASKDSMTAEGMLCRMYLGWRVDDPRILAGCEQLTRHPIVTGIDGRDYYYWYYASNALHHAGGSAWRKWNGVMKEALPELQLKTGRERGSWPPQGDPHGGAGGRLYSTVLSILCLEAYYRHMPLSEMATSK